MALREVSDFGFSECAAAAHECAWESLAAALRSTGTAGVNLAFQDCAAPWLQRCVMLQIFRCMQGSGLGLERLLQQPTAACKNIFTLSASPNSISIFPVTTPD